MSLAPPIIPPELLDQSLLYARLASAAYRDSTARQTPGLEKLTHELRLNERNTAQNVSTQALLGKWNNDLVIAFRGTELTLADWWTDLNGTLTATPQFAGRVHSGFAAALQPVYGAIHRFVRNLRDDKTRVFLCGHSLGGALAQLAAYRLATEPNFPTVRGVFTYGAPRVGDANFVAEYRRLPIGRLSQLWVAAGDPVTRVAPHAFEYRHVVPRQYTLVSGAIGVTDLDSIEELRQERSWFADNAVSRTTRWLAERMRDVLTKFDLDQHRLDDSYVRQLEIARGRRS